MTIKELQNKCLHLKTPTMKKIIRFLPLLTIAILASCSSEVLPPQVEVQPAPPVVNPPSTTGNETLLQLLYPFSDKSYFIKG